METVKIDKTFGAGYIGLLVTFFMYGITTFQTYFYFLNYPKDLLQFKLLVTALWVMDTVHVALVSHGIYYYLVSNYMNPAVLDTGIWSIFASMGINLVIALTVQSFFAIRIFRFSKPRYRYWLTSLVFAVVLCHFAFGLETVILEFIKKRFDSLSSITRVAVTPFAMFALLSDILIAGTLCILLHGSKTGFKSTDTLLRTLMIYAVNRCLLTFVVALIETITFLIEPHSLWYLAFDFLIGKLYANSLLATLNTRRVLSQRPHDINDFSEELGVRSTDRSKSTTGTSCHIEFARDPLSTIDSVAHGHVLDLQKKASLTDLHASLSNQSIEKAEQGGPSKYTI